MTVNACILSAFLPLSKQRSDMNDIPEYREVQVLKQLPDHNHWVFLLIKSNYRFPKHYTASGIPNILSLLTMNQRLNSWANTQLQTQF